MLAVAGPALAQSHLWFPGQLAAYMQDYQKRASVARCVNVGYPGRFNPMCDTAYFRCKADGRIVMRATQHRLPTLFGHQADWEVSLDKTLWLQPETDSRYGDADRQPDTAFEKIVSLPPRDFTLLHQAKTLGRDALSMEQGGSAVVDFHELELGEVEFTVKGEGRLECFVGESVEEACSDRTADYEQYALPAITLTGDTRHVRLEQRALRYLRLRATGGCTVSRIKMNALIWPVEQQMTFSCSNDTINRLFDAGVKTLLTSMHNFNLDGVKRDYLPWAMDAVLSSIGTNYVFGDRQMARNDISIALMPPHPDKTMLGVVDYPLHALIGIQAYTDRYGEDGTPEMFRNRIEQQMALYMSMQDERGFISADSTAWGFITGWSTTNGPLRYGTAAYPQMMLYKNFLIAARLEHKWGDEALAALYRQKADSLGRSIKELFWDERRHAFVNGYDANGNKDMRISHHTQYWAVLTDLFPERYLTELYTQTVPSLPGYFTDVSYENGYSALAYEKAGCTEALYDFLKRVWFRWLEEGGTRYPENFSIDSPRAKQLEFYHRPYGLSLCHGANGVPPVIFVLQGILGFGRTDQGYTLHPDLLGMEWAKAGIPVKEGMIEVVLQRGEKPKVVAPKGCRVEVVE